MGRSPCCAKEGLNRGAWTATEDKILTEYIKVHGEGKWRNLPKKAGEPGEMVNQRVLLLGCGENFPSENPVLLCRSQKMWEELQAEVVELSET